MFRNLSCKSDSERGFSFAEVFVGVLVLSLAVIPLYGLVIAGFSGTAASVSHARAFGLARGVLELAGAMPWDQLTAPNVEALAAAVLGPDDAEFTVKSKLLPEKTVPVAGIAGRTLAYRQVVVEVAWTRASDGGRKRDPSQLTLSTVRTRVE